MLLLQGAVATIVPQPLIEPQPELQQAVRFMTRPELQQVLQAEPQLVLQAVAQPVLHGAAATTVLHGAAATTVLHGAAATTVLQLLTGVAQRAAFRLERQVATRPLKARPPIRLPLSQFVVSQHWAKVVAVKATSATNEKTEDKLRTITFLLVTVPFDKTQEHQIPLACESEKISVS